jgi:hypothetical protein
MTHYFFRIEKPSGPYKRRSFIPGGYRCAFRSAFYPIEGSGPQVVHVGRPYDPPEEEFSQAVSYEDWQEQKGASEETAAERIITPP